MTADKWREWLQTFSLLAIPVVVGIMGNAVAKSNATREVDARMIEIAAQVLAGPANDSTRAIRQWAVKELARHSDVPFSPVVESTFVRRGFGGWPREWLGGSIYIGGDTTFGDNITVCDSLGRKCRKVRRTPALR